MSKQKGCLALNASYEPLHMLPVNRAVRFVLEGKAEVEEQDAAKVVRSEKVTMPKPTVIRLKNYVHVPRNMRKQVTNTFLFARDDYTCAYCGRMEKELGKREFLNRDHILPQAQGGPDNWTNCITSCSTCNSKKDNRTPAQAGMKLRFQAVEPHFVHLKWSVRKLTPLQMKYIARFYGEDVVRQLQSLVRK